MRGFFIRKIMIVSIIVAAAENNAIGKNNQLLCHLPKDLKYFKSITKGHAILMGRKTYESIGRPLPERRNMVLSRGDFKADGTETFSNLGEALSAAAASGETELFIIGGDTIYQQALALTNRIYLTRIHHQFEADAWFPALDEKEWNLIHTEFHEADEKNAYDFTFQTFERFSI